MGMMRMASGLPAKQIPCEFESHRTLQTLPTPRTFCHTRVAVSEGVMKRGDLLSWSTGYDIGPSRRERGIETPREHHRALPGLVPPCTKETAWHPYG